MLRHEAEARKCKQIGQGASNTEMAIGQWRMWKLSWREGEEKDKELFNKECKEMFVMTERN
jgi:hypothetical protein